MGTEDISTTLLPWGRFVPGRLEAAAAVLDLDLCAVFILQRPWPVMTGHV